MEPGVILAGGLSLNGRAAVLALLTADFRPVVFDYPFDASSATGAQRNPESGSDLPCSVLTVDLLCGDSIAEALDRAISQVGEIRALVFCDTWAGRTGTKLHEQAAGTVDFRQVINTNVVGVFNLIRLVAAHMAGLKPDEDGQRGVIVTNTYAHLAEPPAGVAAYVSAMGCVQGMNLAIARDLAGFGIRICSIDTEIGNTLSAADGPDQPEAFALLARHIIDNHMLNGTNIRLAGAV